MSSEVTADVPLLSGRSSFEQQIGARRDQVYSYLDNWTAASEFRPQAINDALYSYVRRRGKALRPVLLMLSCAAVGGDEEVALPAAAAVEIYHTWTLVHDDIIDRDDTRRGLPTVHAQYAREAREKGGLTPAEADHYGMSVAILAGDLQQSWVYALLSDLQDRGVHAELVLTLIRRMSLLLTPQLMEGELLDVQYALMPTEALTQEQVLHMLSRKTAALLEYAAWAGAMIGTQGRADGQRQAEILAKFALLSGTAFQLQDDILGLTADEGDLGKPVGSDLREGKRTLVLYRVLEECGPSEKSVLLRTVGNVEATAEDLNLALDIIRRSGAIEGVSALANDHVAQAVALLDELPPSEARSLLRNWAMYLSARRY